MSGVQQVRRFASLPEVRHLLGLRRASPRIFGQGLRAADIQTRR
jgi:hypothetical protein